MADCIKVGKIAGLSGPEAKNRLQRYGKNSVEERKPDRLLTFIKKFWSPVPWMLEITIILQIVLHKYDEAIIIFILLVFNSSLSFFQEGRANKALALLRKHLAIKARVLRDSYWQLIASYSQLLCMRNFSLGDSFLIH